jgi:threonine synthase
MHRKAEEEGALALGADRRQRGEAPPGRREPDCSFAGRSIDGEGAALSSSGAAGPATRRPRMWGYQATGAAPIVVGHPITCPETIATAIRIGNPASWSQAVAAREESGGLIDTVTDEEILVAHRLLSASEGVFVEPASAASVAGLLQSHAAGLLDPGQVVVCTVTGHGLKDPQWALRSPDGSPVEPTLVPADAAAVASVLGLRA